jgi:glycosyltransferase 2 family protein
MSKPSSWLKRLQPLIGVAAFGLAAFLVYRALRQHSMGEIIDSLRSISLGHLALGAALTAISFLCLTGYDALAVRYTERDLPYRKMALVSFIALSIGHTLGLAALSSGAVRYRFYTQWGLSPGDVGRIVLFCGMTVALGLGTVAGISALVRPDLIAEIFGVAQAAVSVVGILLLALVAGYVGLALFVHRPIRIRRFELPVPPAKLALGQIVVGTADFLSVSAVLHQMLSASADIEFFPVAAVYSLANAAAIVSHVPGGLGVIEAIVLSLYPGANVIGALIAFRAIYYLIPFVIGCLVLGAVELARRRRVPVEQRPSA